MPARRLKPQRMTVHLVGRSFTPAMLRKVFSEAGEHIRKELARHIHARVHVDRHERRNTPDITVIRELVRTLDLAKSLRVSRHTREAIIDATDVAWREHYARQRRKAKRK